MRSIPDIVKQLIIINALFFAGSFLINPNITAIATDLLALHYPGNDRFGIWQLLTHMFMHGGFTHILFNMFGLWMFGSPLAQMWGKNKFLFFYLSTGVGAAALQLLVYHLQIQGWVDDLVVQGYALDEIYSSLQQQTQSLFHVRMVGASGALYGVLVAFAFITLRFALPLIPWVGA